jgi:hypothetical protein
MQADEGGMLTMDDSRMSVGGSLLTMDDSRMSAGGACALMPEELAEWRVVGDSNSSLPSGEHLVASSHDVSRDVPSLAAESRGRLFGDHSASLSASRMPPLERSRVADTEVDLFDRELPSNAAAATTDGQTKPYEVVVPAQWLQPESSSDSSTDGVDASPASLVHSPCLLPASALKKAQPGKSAPKPKGGGAAGAGGKGAKQVAKAAKGGQDGDGDGEGKLSGMWTSEENNIFFGALGAQGRSFPQIHVKLQNTKTREQVRCYYYRVIKKINQVSLASSRSAF